MKTSAQPSAAGHVRFEVGAGAGQTGDVEHGARSSRGDVERAVVGLRALDRGQVRSGDVLDDEPDLDTARRAVLLRRIDREVQEGRERTGTPVVGYRTWELATRDGPFAGIIPAATAADAVDLALTRSASA